MGPTQSLMPVMNLAQLQEAEQTELDAEAAQQDQLRPEVVGLAGYVRRCWTAAKMFRDSEIQKRLDKCMLSRKGQYDTATLSEIARAGGSSIYMMLIASKCRAASALLRDIYLGSGADKPWAVRPTPVPEMPPEVLQKAMDDASGLLKQMMDAGAPLDMESTKELMEGMRMQYVNELAELADERMEQAEKTMEDQLDQGNWITEFSHFMDDLATFPLAVMKGPIVRNRPKMAYDPQGNIEVKDDLTLEWERVSPYDFYPAPHCRDVNGGYICEHHRLTIEDLQALIGVEGYSEDAIRSVMADNSMGGLKNWMGLYTSENDTSLSTSVFNNSPEALIDALQFWGSVQGQLLIDWGMEGVEAKDAQRVFYCEVWMIDKWVIKATLNPHPVGHKPYFVTSFEKVPGQLYGRAIPELIEDCGAMCNATARALANNMAISSGPQAWVNIDRLPAGEQVTEMFPWKIWQTTSDLSGAGGSQAPIGFFQPQSNAQELMMVFNQFETAADEYSGIPRYMTGNGGGAGGAGRTASGMSMMIGNASKTIRQVVVNIDLDVLKPMLERLFFHNMKNGKFGANSGDLNVVARGVLYMQVRDSVAMRRTEFLQLALTNPVVNQIVGPAGIAQLLREGAKGLNMDVDKLVPSDVQLKLQQMQAQKQQQAMMMAQQNGMVPPGPQGPGGPPQGPGAAPLPKSPSPAAMPGPGQTLGNGAPMTDNFQPSKR